MVTPVSLYADDLHSLGKINNNGHTSGIKRAEGKSSFDTIFSAAVDMYKEADSLQKAAEAEEMSFALGYSDSIHDLAVAQQKANISLQYTVKITNTVVQAYKELMNMQL